MSVPTPLIALAGKWQGTNKLWMYPEAPVKESDSMLEISPAAMGKFASLHYTWAEEGQAQEGLLLVGSEVEAQAQVVWVDAWHMQDKMMICLGSMESNGGFSVRGTYAAPPGPDWGWRITLEAQEAGNLCLRMYNQTPDGLEALAVETIYRRIS
jgi:hypothetical protein